MQSNPTIAHVGGELRRSLTARLEVRADNTVEASLSSETPYPRDFGNEILVHTPDAVNLERAATGLPLLFQHDPSRQIGRVENIRLKGRKLVGTLRPSVTAQAQEIWGDILSGIRQEISIGYLIEAVEQGAGSDVFVTRWCPYEISSVSVPADPTVGVGRARTAQTGIIPMTAQSVVTDDNNQIRAERNRVQGINVIARRLGIPDELSTRAIEEGWEPQRMLGEHERAAGATPPLRTYEPRPDEHLRRAVADFSLTRAIADVLKGNRPTGLEAEIGQELSRSTGRTAQGFFMPSAALQVRTQLGSSPAAGGNLIGTDHRDDLFVSPLRNQSLVMQLGATVLNDVVGDIDIPRQDNTVTGTWVADDAAAPESDLQFGRLTMSPKTVTANLSWSRKMAIQAQPALEPMMRGELSAQLGLALDLASLHGTGSSNQPTGVFNKAGVSSIALGADGGAPECDDIVGLETAIALNNADVGSLGYLTNAKVRGQLKKTPVLLASGAEMIWQGGSNQSDPFGRMNGYRAGCTNQVRSDFTKGTSVGNCSGIAFGNWRDLLIGMWSGIDIVVDPYTFSTQGRIRITAILNADIAVRRVQSFAICTDVLTA